MTTLTAAIAAALLGSSIASAGGPRDGLDDVVVIVEDPTVETPESQIVTIQGGGLMFLDAHEAPDRDWNVVMRQFQNNDSQRWRMTDMGGGLVTLMQMNTGRYLDAHEIPELDYRVVTRPRQDFDDTQLWRLTDYGGGFVTIQHYDTGLFLEPVLDPGYDFQVVLRPERLGDNLQTWRIGG